MSSTLKQELKSWEAQFRADHGRDPTKEDIKQDPEIARKYKEYNKSKQASSKVGTAPSVFKTPTKPSTSRQSTSRNPPNDRSSTTGVSSSSTADLSSDATSKTNGTKYVLANSPSKLRALAAMHSTSGSPNRPSGPNWQNAAASSSSSVSASADPSSKQRSKADKTSSSSSTAPPPADFNRSPRKALNPFASPKKKEIVTIQPPSRGTTLFEDFEKLERDKVRKKKSRIKVKSGMGWGHAGDVLTTTEAGRNHGADMDIDEVDDFFGGGNSAKKPRTAKPLTRPESPHSFLESATLSVPSIFSPPSRAIRGGNGQESATNLEEDDDEMLGPSPVKASSFQRASSFGTDHSKPFKPLFDVLPQPARLQTTESNAQPKLFATSLRTNSIPPEDRSARGTKRANVNGKEKSRDEMDALLEDGDDDFYADALDAAEKELEEKNGATKGKKKRVAGGAGRGKGRGKTKGRTKEVGEDHEQGGGEDPDPDELRVARDESGGLVLDFRVEGGGGETRERVMIHQQGREPRKPRQDKIVVDKDGGGGEEDPSEESDNIPDEVSLLDRPQPRAIISSRSQAPPNTTQEQSSHGHASLPTELASMLSFRASPQKSTTSAKDRQVAKLLGEPTIFASQRQRGGLLELEDELDDGEEAGEEGEEEGDDDWDDEVDGWKQTGEAMDGYYSGGEDW